MKATLPSSPTPIVASARGAVSSPANSVPHRTCVVMSGLRFRPTYGRLTCWGEYEPPITPSSKPPVTWAMVYCYGPYRLPEVRDRAAQRIEEPPGGVPGEVLRLSQVHAIALSTHREPLAGREDVVLLNPKEP